MLVYTGGGILNLMPQVLNQPLKGVGDLKWEADSLSILGAYLAPIPIVPG